jgi:muramoyltetrapeptide carboxypeptidase
MKPESLKEGDKVIILSPAGALNENFLFAPMEVLSSWGLDPILSENSKSRHHEFAGTDEVRRDAFQSAIDDPKIKAIFCARGGYGSTRIIDELDWSKFIEHPKWIIGYSDITTFHNRLNQLNCESLHATMPKDYKTNTRYTMDSLKSSLFNTPPKYSIDNSDFNRPGKTKGKMIGGNLSIIHNLIGTKFNIQFKDNILFLEEIGEYYYSVDRMLWALKHAGIFDEISGLIIGSFTNIKQNDIAFPETIESMILKFVEGRDIPVVFDFPSGHEDDNWSLIMSGNYKLEVDNRTSVIEYVFPELD